MVDGFVLTVLSAAVMGGAYFALSASLRQSAGPDSMPVNSNSAEMSSLAVFTLGAVVVLFANLFLYSALLESSRHQATLGKLVLRIKVIDLQGKRISFWRSPDAD